MRSRAELRRAIEWALRAALVAGLALALWRSLHVPAARAVARHATVRQLDATLRDATLSPSVSQVDVVVDSLPDRASRAWLSALRGAGVSVRWNGTPRPLAVEAARTREPESRLRVAVAADSGSAIVLADSAGVLDTLRVGARGASFETPAAVGAVRASHDRFAAMVAVPRAEPPRALLVLGRAGWESRFVAGAVQEAGWTVRSRQPAAPGVVIADAGLLPIDTARYAAVVALDSTAADLGPAIARFVAQGGGLVLAGGTPALAALAPLSAARVGARAPGRILLDGDAVTRADLPARPLAVRGDAVRLEGTPSGAAVAVRRAGMGRVLTLGYDETWRWRMLGGASGLTDHRAWWSQVVGIVAPMPDVARVATGDAAPLASLVNELGPASTLDSRGTPRDAPSALPLLLLASLVVLLLAETASRRFRGAR
jgi:hypothetical protein